MRYLVRVTYSNIHSFDLKLNANSEEEAKEKAIDIVQDVDFGFGEDQQDCDYQGEIEDTEVEFCYSLDQNDEIIINNPVGFTYFLDIDGTILQHNGTLEEIRNLPAKALPKVVDFINKCIENKCTIILTTARPEEDREITEKQLKMCNIAYHKLIMDVGFGPRVLINDFSTRNNAKRAYAVNVEQDRGVTQKWIDFNNY